MIRRASFTPATVFLLLGIALGAVSIRALKPNGGWDEFRHLLRAYQISEGIIVPERHRDLVGGWFPAYLHAPWMVAVYPPEPDGRFFADFRNTALYPPVAYLPHAAVLAIVRRFEPSLPTLIYTGRSAALALGLALAWLAIRTTPIMPWGFAAVALSPMALRQMTTVTADTFTNGSAFVLTAAALRFMVDRDAPASPERLVALAAAGLAVALGKQAYLPLLLLLLLCPRQYTVAVAATVAASLGAVVAWTWASDHLYQAQYIAPGANPRAQLARIVDEPIRYAGILWTHSRSFGALKFAHALGYGPLVPPWFGWLHGPALVAIAWLDARLWLPLVPRVIAVTASAATYVLIDTMAYLGWHDVGAPALKFIQGRYYLPLVPLLMLAIAGRPARLAPPWRDVVAAATLTAFAIATGIAFR